jgi:hypothetical protein
LIRASWKYTQQDSSSRTPRRDFHLIERRCNRSAQ